MGERPGQGLVGKMHKTKILEDWKHDCNLHKIKQIPPVVHEKSTKAAVLQNDYKQRDAVYLSKSDLQGQPKKV